MITVLIADDQAMVRAGFAALLDAYDDIQVVGQAPDGAAAVELARERRPDVVLMDVRMPGTDGIAATRTLTQGAGPGEDPPKVIMLTTFDIDEYVFEALRAGASGFLLKDALPDELAAAVRIVVNGDALLAPSVTRRLIEQYATGSVPQRTDRAVLEQLTEREREILTLVARGLSNAEIAASLFIAEQTVKTHVSRILQKLGLRDRAQAVMVAYESRLVLPS
jgi:DNA-binding NarL/FixJ family response regulator